MLWLSAFLGGVGKGANSDKEGKLGALFGAGGFSLSILLMSLALLCNLNDVGGSQIPKLLSAGKMHSTLANVFSIIILLGIFTTSVPLQWTVMVRFTKENTRQFTGLTIILGGIGAIIGLSIDFDALVNVVYVLNDYIGAILLIIMIVRSIQWKRI